jgi:polysaccharide export outer membrane protein
MLIMPKSTNGIFMITRLYLFMLVILLSSCSLLPGMQNPNMSQMNKTASADKMNMVPTLIPITPSLIADSRNSQYVYHVAPADILNIIVWQHPEFYPHESPVNQITTVPSTQGAAGQEGFLVNPNGDIYFPLIGKVAVAGETVDGIRENITRRLTKYLKNPDLNVRVADFRSRKVYVLGEVIKPGFIPLNDQPLSITDAIVLKGGLDPNAADPSHIYIIRGSMQRPDIYWLDAKTPDALLLAEHFYLKPNDILFVSSAAATRWNRVINQLLPTIQTVWYTKAIVNSNNN